MGSIEEKKAQRLRFMNELYDAVDGITGRPVDTRQLADKLGLNVTKKEDLDKIWSIADYLEGEGLIKTTGAMASGVVLKHKGVVEVERSRSEPSKPTEHFPPANNISVQYDRFTDPAGQS